MAPRKRAREETEEQSISGVVSEPQHESGGLLNQLRGMWEFANLVQYIYMFGKVMKVNDDFDIEDLETECLKPGHSDTLLDIGLSLLKFVSSHRGLNSENFEEYTRRQYNAKAPGQKHPFGDDEKPKKFHELDMFEKIRVLQKLSTWTLWNPDRFREKMPEQKENEQVQWRVEELGYDRDERLYYLLDDNRLYRRTEPPIPPPKAAKPKANSKRGRAAARAAKRRKIVEDDDEEESRADDSQDSSQGYKWECIAVTLADYRALIDKIRKTKDPNEEILRDRLLEQVIPTIEKAEEVQLRKIQRKEKELINLQKMAGAKRSSRIAGKQEKERQELLAIEEEKKREVERAAAKKGEELKQKIEKERIYRLMTREQRLKDREEKRMLHEQHLQEMEEQAKKLENGEARVSERQLKAMMEKGKQDLQALQTEEAWFFDCSVCGVHGENLDDGSHSVACEKCNVWQHSHCLKIPKEEAESEDFHFICADCKRRIEDAKKPKLPPLKFRLPTSASPPSVVVTERRKQPSNEESPVKKPKKPRTIPSGPAKAPGVPPVTNGAAGSPTTTHTAATRPAQAHPLPQPSQNGAARTSQTKQYIWDAAARLGQQPQPSFQPPSDHKPELNYKFIQHVPRPAASQATNTSSFNSQRPSSSYSNPGSFPSPIQNRPSMSPTQGNRGVIPLPGYPSSAAPAGAPPSTPFNRNQAHHNAGTPYMNQTPANSFSATAHASFATPPPNYSQLAATSGLSPTKQSPPRGPPSFSPKLGHTAILPPVQKLQPSPKLMGRSSPDAPIPAPVKSMTPEQEDRRRREMAQAHPTEPSLQYPPILHPASTSVSGSFYSPTSK